MRTVPLAVMRAVSSGRSEIEFSVSGPPPARSEGPGPLFRKQKHVLFRPLHDRYIRHVVPQANFCGQGTSKGANFLEI